MNKISKHIYKLAFALYDKMTISDKIKLARYQLKLANADDLQIKSYAKTLHEEICTIIKKQGYNPVTVEQISGDYPRNSKTFPVISVENIARIMRGSLKGIYGLGEDNVESALALFIISALQKKGFNIKNTVLRALENAAVTVDVGYIGKYISQSFKQIKQAIFRDIKKVDSTKTQFTYNGIPYTLTPVYGTSLDENLSSEDESTTVGDLVSSEESSSLGSQNLEKDFITEEHLSDVYNNMLKYFRENMRQAARLYLDQRLIDPDITDKELLPYINSKLKVKLNTTSFKKLVKKAFIKALILDVDTPLYALKEIIPIEDLIEMFNTPSIIGDADRKILAARLWELSDKIGQQHEEVKSFIASLDLETFPWEESLSMSSESEEIERDPKEEDIENAIEMIINKAEKMGISEKEGLIALLKKSDLAEKIGENYGKDAKIEVYKAVFNGLGIAIK